MINYKKMIAIEGIDGSGKTLQTDLLISFLQKQGKQIETLSFPQYNSFFGKTIGSYLRGNGVRADEIDAQSMSLWYALDRWKTFQTLSGSCDILISNRYTLSNAVYQSIRTIDLDMDGNGNMNHWSWVKQLEHEQLGLPEPDLYLILDVYPSNAQYNVDQKGKRDYIDGRDVYEEQAGLLLRARNQYRAIASKEERIALIPCMKDGVLASPAYIQDQLIQSLQKHDIIG